MVDQKELIDLVLLCIEIIFMVIFALNQFVASKEMILKGKPFIIIRVILFLFLFVYAILYLQMKGLYSVIGGLLCIVLMFSVHGISEHHMYYSGLMISNKNIRSMEVIKEKEKVKLIIKSKWFYYHIYYTQDEIQIYDMVKRIQELFQLEEHQKQDTCH